MKITILYKFIDGPWGGANQFLKALRSYFKQIGCYEEEPSKADVLLFISYPFNNEKLFRVVKRLKERKNIIVINRMNGPISLYRSKDIEVDNINFTFNHDISDGTVFQSEWSRQQCYALGMKSNTYECVIPNASDPQIFYPLPNGEKETNHRRTKIIATSWSDNAKKGFDIYEYLDTNLDFNRYEMTFIGKTPIEFKRIKYIQTLPSRELAEQLRSSDIFVFASEIETCSNSLLDALHCGLPAVARNNSSQPEIVGKGGVLFEGREDVLAAIDTVAKDINYFRGLIDIPKITHIGDLYYDFCKRIYNDVRGKINKPKHWHTLNYLKMMSNVYLWKCISKIKYRYEKYRKM